MIKRFRIRNLDLIRKIKKEKFNGLQIELKLLIKKKKEGILKKIVKVLK